MLRCWPLEPTDGGLLVGAGSGAQLRCTTQGRPVESKTGSRPQRKPNRPRVNEAVSQMSVYITMNMVGSLLSLLGCVFLHPGGSGCGAPRDGAGEPGVHDGAD